MREANLYPVASQEHKKPLLGNHTMAMGFVDDSLETVRDEGVDLGTTKVTELAPVESSVPVLRKRLGASTGATVATDEQELV